MLTKQTIISSSGLKNVVLNKFQEDEDFVFIFGKQEFQMKSFFAEFISPIVSHFHQADPTIKSINFGKLNTKNENEFNELSKSILTPETISLLQQISSGFSIDINEEQAIKLRFLSILLGNDELHSKLTELFPQNYNEENVNSYLNTIECYYHFSHLNIDFDFTSLLSFISSHFYKLNKEEFLRLPRNQQLQIISHPKLLIESEDSLFDIVIEIIENKIETDEIDNVLFLEQLEFSCLSDDRLRTFIDLFDVNEMSGELWHKLSQRLIGHCNNISKRALRKYKPSIIVCGDDAFNQLGKKPNHKNEDGNQFISPPLKISLDPTTLLSYSVYYSHSVLITNDGILFGIGDNKDGKISSSLNKTEISNYTKFSIEDERGRKLVPISAVCCTYGTLYMLSKSSGLGRQLVYCDDEINGGNPVYLDIGNKEPVALFGGSNHSAVICSEGEVIFINCFSVKNSPESRIEAVSLPNDEKASSVACCDDAVVVLSLNGRVFSSVFEEESNELSFSAVEELACEEIVCLSGTNGHCLAISKEGRVFGRGSNDHGQLGLGEETDSVSSFTEISSLEDYEIRAAYAGGCHSLFETKEGKILSCGSNICGQLLLKSGPSENVYTPKETAITGDATFCIAGCYTSVIFNGSIPNIPNKRIESFNK